MESVTRLGHCISRMLKFGTTPFGWQGGLSALLQHSDRQGTDLLSHGNASSPHHFLMIGGLSLKRYSEVATQQILTRLFLRCCLCLSVVLSDFPSVS